MKLTQKIITAVLALGLGFAVAPAHAAEEFTYGIVDMVKIRRDSEAAKNLKTDLDAKLKEYTQQFAKKEDDLRKAEQELVKQQGKLSKEEFDKKRKEFQGNVASFQKQVADRKKQLDGVYNEAMSKLHLEVLKATADVAKSKDLKAVFSQEAMVLADPDLDLTKEIMDKLNATTKKIPLNDKK